MAAGALSRTMAQTIMHPANTYKTILQLKGNSKALQQLTPERLLRGADAQFLLSLPHGAFYFFVIDAVKKQLNRFLPSKLDFLGDFASSTVSTIICSIVSTPQMVLTDRLMAGVYPSFPSAVRTILSSEGAAGFYTGWWPALAQKIPSYGLTWMFFQQLKRLHEHWAGTPPNAETNFGLGAVAAAAAVCVMIPIDTVKTRLVIQSASCPLAYKGMRDCLMRILREEGVGALYSSLPPRLLAVVPMIAIQFGVYEGLRHRFEKINFEQRTERLRLAARARAQAINKRVKTVRQRVSSRIAHSQARRSEEEDVFDLSPHDSDNSHPFSQSSIPPGGIVKRHINRRWYHRIVGGGGSRGGGATDRSSSSSFEVPTDQGSEEDF